MYERFWNQFTEYIFVENEPQKSDIIFVPGNRFPQMAEQAAALWKKNLAPLILVSGCHALLQDDFHGVTDITGKYQGTFDTEADYLRHILLEQGVPEKAILSDWKATYTYENAIFSREITDQQNLTINQAILCCNSYHARRCLLYYQLLYPETNFLVVPSDTGINRTNWMDTEKGIDTVLGEIERCGGQFHKIMRELP